MRKRQIVSESSALRKSCLCFDAPMKGECSALARQTRVTDYNWRMRSVVSVEYFYYYFILNDIFSAFFSPETFNYFFRFGRCSRWLKKEKGKRGTKIF